MKDLDIAVEDTVGILSREGKKPKQMFIFVFKLTSNQLIKEVSLLAGNGTIFWQARGDQCLQVSGKAVVCTVTTLCAPPPPTGQQVRKHQLVICSQWVARQEVYPKRNIVQ